MLRHCSGVHLLSVAVLSMLPSYFPSSRQSGPVNSITSHISDSREYVRASYRRISFAAGMLLVIHQSR
jgi:hypothetical protein